MTYERTRPDDLRPGRREGDKVMAEISRLPGPIAPRPGRGKEKKVREETPPPPAPTAALGAGQRGGAGGRPTPDFFSPPGGGGGPARRNRDEAAKAVCLTCPVLNECRTHAL